jgi:hypothetical protein
VDRVIQAACQEEDADVVGLRVLEAEGEVRNFMFIRREGPYYHRYLSEDGRGEGGWLFYAPRSAKDIDPPFAEMDPETCPDTASKIPFEGMGMRIFAWRYDPIFLGIWTAKYCSKDSRGRQAWMRHRFHYLLHPNVQASVLARQYVDSKEMMHYFELHAHFDETWRLWSSVLPSMSLEGRREMVIEFLRASENVPERPAQTPEKSRKRGRPRKYSLFDVPLSEYTSYRSNVY